jgi:hypothetical protein
VFRRRSLLAADPHQKVIVNPTSLLLFFAPVKKVDDGDEPLMVDIMIKKNQGQYREEAILSYWDFHWKWSFCSERPQEIPDGDFDHLGIANNHKTVDECLHYLLQVTTSRARDQQLVSIFKQGRQQFAKLFKVEKHQYDAFVRDKNLFFE